MVVVGRITGKVDPRWLIAIGFTLCSISLWQMSGLSPQVDAHPIIWSGVIQGFGTGLAYVSLTVVAFVTLPGALRNEGTAFFNLTRNIGSSIGISLIQAYVTSGTTTARATLTESITPYNAIAAQPQVYSQFDSTSGLVALNQAVVTQASWITYLNAFYIMMILTAATIPLILFARSAKQAKSEKPVLHE
jgi:DHA2 family multidrug resistance protein